MSKETVASVTEYLRAFQELVSEGIHENHIALLREHFNAPNHTVTWARLAKAVGYANRNAVQLQYGTLAGRVAAKLGIKNKPYGFWLNVLTDWAQGLDRRGHTQFVLRQPVIKALLRLGILDKDESNRNLYPDDIEQGHRYVEGARKQVWVNAFERNPQARRACINRYGARCVVCRLSLAERYGKLGEGFIHVHHLKPMAMKKGRYKLNPERDLRPVCPNCHAMLHRAESILSIAQLRRRLHR